MDRSHQPREQPGAFAADFIALFFYMLANIIRIFKAPGKFPEKFLLTLTTGKALP
jgi:hypothetical protein